MTSDCEHVWQGADKVVIQKGKPVLVLEAVCVFCGKVRTNW